MADIDLCKQTIPKCYKCSAESNYEVCEVCNSGFYGELCSKCEDTLAHCLTCTDSFTCTYCDEHYVAFNGKCHDECPSGIIDIENCLCNNVNKATRCYQGQQCYPRAPEDDACMTTATDSMSYREHYICEAQLHTYTANIAMEPGSYCQKVENKFYYYKQCLAPALYGSECACNGGKPCDTNEFCNINGCELRSECQDLNCASCDTKTSIEMCTTCQAGYFINFGGKCDNCSNNIPNCELCDTKGNNCSQCAEGYYLNEYKRCSACTPSLHCRSCTDGNACTSCPDFYNLSGNICQKEKECPDNCGQCYNDNCYMCYEGYQLDNKMKCLACAIGYKMVNQRCTKLCDGENMEVCVCNKKYDEMCTKNQICYFKNDKAKENTEGVCYSKCTLLYQKACYCAGKSAETSCDSNNKCQRDGSCKKVKQSNSGLIAGVVVAIVVVIAVAAGVVFFISKKKQQVPEQQKKPQKDKGEKQKTEQKAETVRQQVANV